MRHMTKTPSESDEQATLFAWADMMKARWPELELMFHIPNGGSRHPLEAVHLKRQGVKPGVPDIFLPAARGGYHGLWIEMKRQTNSRLSDYQKDMIQRLICQRYRVAVCHGFEEARKIITLYLEGRL